MHPLLLILCYIIMAIRETKINHGIDPYEVIMMKLRIGAGAAPRNPEIETTTTADVVDVRE
jgi:hypothetical protein